MTVASMPMWSAATRSMLLAAAATPRKKLPPPTTNPICTPARATSAISSARCFTRSGSMPKELPPASTSPLSLRTMRWYFGMIAPPVTAIRRSGVSPLFLRSQRRRRL